MLDEWEKDDCNKRSRSTPPIARHEFGMLPDDRLDRSSDFYVDSALLKPYAEIKTIRKTISNTVLWLDKKYILKLLSPGQDIHETVALMNLARTVVPVPAVYNYGYSGNCSFILMEFVRALPLDAFIRCHGQYLSTLPQVLQQVDRLVGSLARLDISHNDLYPRNVLVDETLRIVSVIDWDGAAP
ncbi:hypothetical protein CERSUDRAFT_100553 [Gelatoporia subvermispora B]|uniref:Protein kinase domain-containing protein n=1 Tax=Ceriporiopsis subvermispora (strain B) TaxID=914234 RepID=M2QZH7_CERS8|nr:hypothetical protein CERSUDRAFT_100553 [Gelatoporia subvermispora B]